MNRQYMAYGITAVYILIMAMGMYLMHHQFGYSHGSPEMNIPLIFGILSVVSLLMTAVMIVVLLINMRGEFHTS